MSRSIFIFALVNLLAHTCHCADDDDDGKCEVELKGYATGDLVEERLNLQQEFTLEGFLYIPSKQEAVILSMNGAENDQFRLMLLESGHLAFLKHSVSTYSADANTEGSQNASLPTDVEGSQNASLLTDVEGSQNASLLTDVESSQNASSLSVEEDSILATSVNTVPERAWFHVAITRSADIVTLYKNGAVEAVCNFCGEHFSNVLSTRVGSGHPVTGISLQLPFTGLAQLAWQPVFLKQKGIKKLLEKNTVKFRLYSSKTSKSCQK